MRISPNIRKILLAGMAILIVAHYTYSQVQIFESEKILDKIRQGIDKSYNYEFDKADSIFDEVEKMCPGHPVNPFLRGFLIYWEENPITPICDRSGEFLDQMILTTKISQKMTEKDEENIEGIFFDLVGHALLLLYYADNGNSKQVFQYVGPSYRRLKQGFLLDDEFPEFRFFTGVYNYYREVYPIIHPVYKPIAMFFPSGDKDYGWQLLLWIKDNSVFLRAEALYFLSHIAMSMQDDPELSLSFSEEVLKLFPHNNFFRVRHMLGLNSAGKYGEMKRQVNLLKKDAREDQFAVMGSLIFGGIVKEKLENNYDAALKLYREGLKVAEQYGVRVDNYVALAHLGISRIYQEQGDNKLARTHWRMAKSIAKYDYILKDR
jgi:tetratricopeptide (TPR) repeat protein